MIKIKILNKIYHLISEPFELSIEKGREIHQIQEAYFDSANKIEMKRKIINVLANIQDNALDIVTDRQIERIYDNLDFLNKDIIFKTPELIFIKGSCYRRLHVKDMIVDEYFDIENFISDDYDNFLEKIIQKNYKKVWIINMTNIISLHRTTFLYKKLKRSGKKEISLRAIKRGINYNLAKSIVFDYVNERNELLKKYGLIDKGEKVTENTGARSIFQMWGIYDTLQKLSNNDESEVERWLKRPVLQLFKKQRYINDLTISENGRQ